MDEKLNKYFIDAQPSSPEPPECKAPIFLDGSGYGQGEQCRLPKDSNDGPAVGDVPGAEREREHKHGKPSGRIAALCSKVKSPFAKLAQGFRSPESRPKMLQGAVVGLVALIALTLPLAYVIQDTVGKPKQTATAEEAPPAQTQPTYLSGGSQPAQNDFPAPSDSPAPSNTQPPDGFYSYNQGDTGGVSIGIDVSEHQGEIDWQAVADNGISFAFVRVGNRGYTAGDISLDGFFRSNIQGAKAAGLLVGVYFFSQAVNENEAREEADFVLRQLGGQSLDLPVVYDFEPVTDEEGRANGLSGQQRSRNAKVFCERVEANGYTAMLYGNATDISYYAYDYSLLTSYDIWIASYSTEPPTAQFEFSYWQFTSNGIISGINTFVDLNLRFDPSEGPKLPPNVIFHSE